MRLRRNRKKGILSRVRRLGILLVLAGAGFLLWKQLQGRRDRSPASTPYAPSAAKPGHGGSSGTTTASRPSSTGSTATTAPGVADAPSLDGETADATSGKIKGNAGSMLYHTTDSPYYKRTKAQAWFETEDEARAAGFQRWDHKRTSGA